jgi:putative nucleotidyltransferase with HDIG domain
MANDAAQQLRELVKQRVSNRVRAGNLEVPVLPHIAMQVLTLTNDPSVSAADFVSLLERDQQLSARLLKIANSPVYAGRVRITSIQRAVVTVGMATLRDLVFSVAMGEQVFRSKRFKEPMERVWEHSLAVAYIAQEVARTKHRGDEHAFLAGLMHDIGKPLLIETIERLDKQLGADVPVSDDFLDEIMRDFHAPVGGLMAKAWRFSPVLFAAIRYHHRFEEAEGGEELALIVNVANDLARALGLGSYSVDDEEFEILEQPGMQAMRFTDREITSLMETLPKITRQLIASFR